MQQHFIIQEIRKHNGNIHYYGNGFGFINLPRTTSPDPTFTMVVHHYLHPLAIVSVLLEETNNVNKQEPSKKAFSRTKTNIEETRNYKTLLLESTTHNDNVYFNQFVLTRLLASQEIKRL